MLPQTRASFWKNKPESAGGNAAQLVNHGAGVTHYQKGDQFGFDICGGFFYKQPLAAYALQ